MTIKELIEMDFKHKCCNSNMPEYAIPREKFHEKNANGLTKCILAYIRLKGHQGDRINNMGVFRKGKTTDLGHAVFKERDVYTSSTRKGIADIKAIKMINIQGRKVGLAVDVEVKYGRDRMSEHQKKIQAEVTATGGAYIIARNFEQFVNEWESIK